MESPQIQSELHLNFINNKWYIRKYVTSIKGGARIFPSGQKDKKNSKKNHTHNMYKNLNI